MGAFMSQLRTMVPNSCDVGGVTSDHGYALLDAFVNGSSEALIAIPPKVLVLFSNRGAESIFGFTSTETRHQPLFDLVVPPNRLQETHDVLQEALRNGRASRQSALRWKDGSLVPVEDLMNVIRDPSGNVAFIALSERDISARMSADDAILTFSSIVQYSDDATVSESLEGTILSWNSRAVRMHGYRAEEAVRMTREKLRALRSLRSRCRG